MLWSDLLAEMVAVARDRQVEQHLRLALAAIERKPNETRSYAAVLAELRLTVEWEQAILKALAAEEQSPDAD